MSQEFFALTTKDCQLQVHLYDFYNIHKILSAGCKKGCMCSVNCCTLKYKIAHKLCIALLMKNVW